MATLFIGFWRSRVRVNLRGERKPPQGSGELSGGQVSIRGFFGEVPVTLSAVCHASVSCQRL